ncbi:fungal-specific transcription factor domain-containing protein [Scheffersomyces xylosifermentans]|uniref:fungal-specific transcription factor domain-containing protein n=1 Tax=Scheffersomyces xylosifermentans TaxID=1304137 RepID=UPI00315DA8E8
MEEKKKIRRSRNGCHNCKRLKIKCDEGKPSCSYCVKTNASCDYSIKLTWGGRPYRDANKRKKQQFSFSAFNTENGPGNVSTTVTSSNQVNHFISSIDKSASSATHILSSENSLNTPTSTFMAPNESSLKRTIDDAEIEDPNRLKVRNVESSDYRSPSASSPAFLTPGGESILSDFDGYNPKDQQDATGIPANATEQSESITITKDNFAPAPVEFGEDGTEIVEDPDHLPKPSTESYPRSLSTDSSNSAIEFSIADNMPEISDGIESLSYALERASNGGQQFLLENSEIFNNFVLSGGVENHYNEESNNQKGNGQPDISNDPQNNSRVSKTESPVSSEDFLSNYSEDLARIEAYMPERSPNYLGDMFPLSRSLRSFMQSANGNSKVSEIDEDDEEPLDSECVLSLSGIRPDGIPSPEEVFATIPPSITPLPELLLHVPFYRNLMHFWVNVASDHLVPAPSYMYRDNPFKLLLPQMAMEYPSILTTLLAFSASIRSTLIGSNDTPEIVTDQLLSRSCNELLKLLKDSKSATADCTLATVLLLSCYEVFNSKDFEKHRAHTIGARQIIMARSSKKLRKQKQKEKLHRRSNNANEGTESDITFFLMRWFAYVDVIGSLSATKNSQNYLARDSGRPYAPIDGVTSLNDLDMHLEDTSNPRDPKRDIDHLLGFDVKFLPQFSEITVLIRKTNAYLSTPGVDKQNIPLEIVTKALEVKEQLMRAYEEGERRRQKKLDQIIDDKIQQKRRQTNSTSPPNLTSLIEQDNILRTTNKIFCDCGILNLYRRVLRIPRESPLVQDLANGIGIMERDTIESRSPADICTIFCSFAAGCETLDLDMRQFFHERYIRLIEMGNINALKGLQIMTRCWQTGEDWIVASKILDIDIALL